jgi:8-oxo-dGTP diphosphatase
MPGYAPFPRVRWKRELATFVAGAITDGSAPTPAALVFPFYGDRLVLADIVTRGWCIPSGHLESGETAEQAVRREALEEAGAVLGRTVPLGHFVLTDHESGTIRHAPTFVAEVTGLSELPSGSESRGRMLAAIEEVATFYFAWDDLLAAVFAAASAVRLQELRPGPSLSSLFNG